MTKIGDNIKKLRQVKNLTQQSFADLFEVTRGNISSYEEKRAEPKIELILKIAKYFSIPVGHLIENSLTVNEILHFDDYFEAVNDHKNVKNLSAIPFISREHLQAKKHLISQLPLLPSIYFPIYNSHSFIAVEYSDSISAPIDFNHKEAIIIFFENISIDTLHTLVGNFGMYLDEDDLFIGKYVYRNEQLLLELNQWKEVAFDVSQIQHFYSLYSVYKKA